MAKTDRVHEVVVLVLEGVLPLDVAIPLQVFAERPGLPYRLTVCGETPGVVKAGSGIGIAVSAGIDALATADTVVVPGYGPPTRPISPTVRAALVDARQRGARIASICYGAFALAEAGLLNGLRATTHWDAAGELARKYPDVDVDPDVLFVDQGTVLSSAGVAAGIDLCLYIVRKDLGARAANDIARRLVTAPRRPGGQAQYTPAVPARVYTQAALDDTRAWAHRHLGEQLTVPQLAAHAKVSTRTFERKFIQETGMPPHRWLLRARLDATRTLLEDTGLSVDQIAQRVGFGSGANLRSHFRKLLGTTPSAYRRSFDSTLRSPSVPDLAP